MVDEIAKSTSMAADMTNTALAKLFSIDFFLILIAVGIAWGAQTTKIGAVEDDIESNATHIKEVEITQKQLTAAVSEIKADVRVIKNSQEYFKESLKKTEQQQTKILEILQREYTNNNHNNRNNE